MSRDQSTEANVTVGPTKIRALIEGLERAEAEMTRLARERAAA